MTAKALSGIKVVEWGELVNAPFCAKSLADMGADVIKIEKPRVGDKARMNGPFPDDKPDPEKSGLFLVLNSNKKSITLNPADPIGKKLLKEVLKDADVFIENNPPSKMKEWGLDYASLKNDFPKLIMISITPWGQTGPYKDYKGVALNCSGFGGIAAVSGNPDREPLDHPYAYVDYRAGTAAANAAMIAIFARDKSKKGQHADIAVYEITSSYDGCGAVMRYQNLGAKSLTIRGGSHANTVFYPAGILPCKDGLLTMFTLDFGHWQKFMKALGNPEWSKDERFNPPYDQGVYMLAQHIDELDALLTETLSNFTKAELFDACRANQVPFLPVMSMEDMVKNPQTQLRNEIIELNHPVAGVQKYPGAPAILSKSPWKLETPAPLLGQHNDEIYIKKLGHTKEEMLIYKTSGIV